MLRIAKGGKGILLLLVRGVHGGGVVQRGHVDDR
jgi:hypothetical protein